MNAIFLTSILTAALGIAQIAGLSNTAPQENSFYRDPIPALWAPKTPFLSLKDYAISSATNAGIDPERFAALVSCESSWNPAAVGDGGKSTGLLQFQKRTFDEFAKKYHMPRLIIEDPYDQIDLASRMIQNGHSVHWERCSARAGLPN